MYNAFLSDEINVVVFLILFHTNQLSFIEKILQQITKWFFIFQTVKINWEYNGHCNIARSYTDKETSKYNMNRIFTFFDQWGSKSCSKQMDAFGKSFTPTKLNTVKTILLHQEEMPLHNDSFHYAFNIVIQHRGW